MVDEAASPVAPVTIQGDRGPRSVGRYLDLGEIASGGMASVHFGRLTGHAGFAREVAIKRLHRHLATDPEFVAMLLDEARLAARVVHANVVPTLDVVAEGGDVCVIMEYVRGLPLSQIFKTLVGRGERIPPRVASAIVGGMLHGLHAAHEATDDRGARLEIVHRDVSPHNVLVGIDGVARLIDFGIAKAEIRLQTTQDGRVKGKFAYMSPEQAQGGKVTRRTDIYAAGVVLWETLTGEHLYRGANELNVILKVMNDVVPPPSALVPDLPPGLDAVVARAMARNPDDRYASARAMAADLDRCAEGASSAEVGEWLVRIGAEALAERSKRVAALEHAALDVPPTSGLLRTGGYVAAAEPIPSSATRLSPRTRGELTTIADVGTPASLAPLDAPLAARRRAARVSLLLATLFGGGFIAVLALYVFHARVGESLAASPPPPAASIAAGAAPPSPPAPPFESASPPPPIASAPLPAPVLPPPPAPRASADPPRRDAPSPAHHHRHPADCVPSTVDSAGHTHFNAACL